MGKRVTREQLERAKRDSFGQILIQAARRFNEFGLARLRTLPRYRGVRAAHLQLFPHLSLDGSRITELAAKIEVSKQAVGQLIDDLQGLDLVERIPDPDDGRAKLVRFTARGRASLVEGLEQLGQVQGELTERVGEERMRRLHRDLLVVLDALRAMAED
ncbi:MAG: MarR family winged helix-turn-helix transcriptional regulator [Myxococcota bacterium]